MMMVLCLAACEKPTETVKPEKAAEQDIEQDTEEPQTIADPEPAEEAVKEPETLLFRDVYGEEYTTEISPNVPKNPYQNDRFRHEGQNLFYDDTRYDCLHGVDVSHHQGYIDWSAVKNQGYDFAILRIGYRGYGAEGTLNPDTEFTRNLANAKSAGLLVGVYFFSQAIDTDEAKDEAEYVLRLLSGQEIDLPVVYDPESILDDDARTDNVTKEQFTENSIAFCETIKAAGYETMIYANMLWEAFQLDMEQLTAYPFWYADYEALPQTPYDFLFWQYSNEGQVDGISGQADLNIWMRKID